MVWWLHFCKKSLDFLEIPRRYCHTDSQAAGAAVSITSMQNWPHGQIRFCYAKSVGERQVNSCSNPGKPLGFPRTCLGQGWWPAQVGGDDVYRSGAMTCTGRGRWPAQVSVTTPHTGKPLGFPKTCDNENNKRAWQVAGFTASISSLQNWPQARFARIWRHVFNLAPLNLTVCKRAILHCVRGQSYHV